MSSGVSHPLFCSFAFAWYNFLFDVIFRLQNEAQKWTKQISRDISNREERMKSKQEERQQTLEKVQQTFYYITRFFHAPINGRLHYYSWPVRLSATYHWQLILI